MSMNPFIGPPGYLLQRAMRFPRAKTWPPIKLAIDGYRNTPPPRSRPPRPLCHNEEHGVITNRRWS
jgi:hypothetical protein